MCYVSPVQVVNAVPRYSRAMDALAELLGKLRIDFIFAGNVARAAWLGGEVSRGSLDVIALLKPEQKNQVAMMGGNRGFRVDRDQIEQSEELDLVPLNFVDPDGEIRVHVLVASNALYGTMVASASRAVAGEREIKIPSREDAALLLALSEDEEAVRVLAANPDFDRATYNRKLVSIGLRDLTL